MVELFVEDGKMCCWLLGQTTPQKTCVNAFGITQTEMEHLESSSHAWAINGEPVIVGWEFTHLGINYICTLIIQCHSQHHCGWKTDTWQEYWLCPHAGTAPCHKRDQTQHFPKHIYNVYGNPRILYSLEATFINLTNLKRLEVAHRAPLWNIQGIPKRTVIAALYIRSGSLPIEELIDGKRLNMILPMANNRTLYDLIHRQIAVKNQVARS